MKIAQAEIGAIVLALFATLDVKAQNVGIGFSNPQSKLAVNGNLAVGSGYNTVAPSNGALIQGFVGIGTTAPMAPLHVGVGALVGVSGSYSWFDAISTALTQGTVSGNDNISGIFGAKVYANTITGYGGSYIAGSDARLKNVIGRSDSAADLETLKKIEITDYTMKDTGTYGSRPLKKVIAQQVEQVYPIAVKSIGLKGVTFTPDVYVVAQFVRSDKPDVYTIGLAKAHGLKDGDVVRLITPKNPALNASIHVVDSRTFSVVSKEPLGDKVFIYGKECSDLKGVDYDAVSMLNVSATQELAKKVETLEQDNSELQNENKRLTAVEEQDHAEIASLRVSNDKLAAMTAKIEVLEKTVATMQEKEDVGVRRAALRQ